MNTPPPRQSPAILSALALYMVMHMTGFVMIQPIFTLVIVFTLAYAFALRVPQRNEIPLYYSNLIVSL